MLSQLSPLSPTESQDIMDSLNGKIVRTFQYAIVLAFFRFITTLLSFWFVDFQVIWIFAFLSGFLSVIPVLSSWVIWVPATLFLFARDGIFSGSWLVVAGSHILLIVVDTFLYNNFFKDQKPEVLGIAIVLGIYAFGWSGVVKGPLSVGITITLLDIYLTYMNASNTTTSTGTTTTATDNSKTPMAIAKRTARKSLTRVAQLFANDDDQDNEDNEFVTPHRKLHQLQQAQLQQQLQQKRKNNEILQ